ncbi:MAG: hypothetical protein NTX45_09655 [Proteobacteria bacterium]|nr:hypothetical protein [Pseudomonadota bacterium]
MGHNRCPCIYGRETKAWQVALIKHLHNRLVTVHGLDFGIPAEMTDFASFPRSAWECIRRRSSVGGIEPQER